MLARPNTLRQSADQTRRSEDLEFPIKMNLATLNPQLQCMEEDQAKRMSTIVPSIAKENLSMTNPTTHIQKHHWPRSRGLHGVIANQDCEWLRKAVCTYDYTENLSPQILQQN